MKSMTFNEYIKVQDQARTIDVRTNSEVKTLLNFSWAENIYVEDLIRNYKSYFPDKNELIITVCNAGNRSGQAAQFLEEVGYSNAFVLTGGIYNYFRNKK
ncbi:rhodanese-like domain-containing protein [Spiroplasma endosymbiont of Panorpa germanica]|uniref:rhodanese-like domain-containing protein n=1 Tax=Spiroplasma endosymbiont of Panorpa germanica TaxID=3066314 RepID=UPI0030CEC3D6